METTPHPVGAWMQKNGVDILRLAVELRRIGIDYKPSYLAQVVSGYFAPVLKLQNGLHTVTGVSIEDIALYPYRAPRTPAKRAAV